MTSPEAHVEAVRRIELTIRTGAETLNLGDLPLVSLPGELGNLTELRELVLGAGTFDPSRDFGFDSSAGRRAFHRPLTSLTGLSRLTSLRRLSLSHLVELRSIAELAPLANLEVLLLATCKKLESLSGIEELRSLTTLNASNTHLHSIAVLQKLPKLSWLCVSIHPGGEDPLNVSGLVHLEHLVLLGGLRSLEGLTELIKLTSLDLGTCRELSDLPDLGALTELRYLAAGGHLKRLRGLDRLIKLTSLNVSRCRDLPELPDLAALTELQYLAVGGRLKRLPGLDKLIKLTSLDLRGCKELSNLPDLAAFTELQSLAVGGRLERLPGVDKLINLTSLNLATCREFSELSDLSALTELQHLAVGGRLKQLPGLGRLVKLTSLDLAMCSDLSDLPDLSAMTELENFAVGGRLKRLPGLDKLIKLTSLDVSRCRDLQELPDLAGFTELQYLAVGGRLKRLPGLDKLIRLTSLDLKVCKELSDLPDLAPLTELESLALGGRPKRLPRLDKLTKLKALDLTACRQRESLPNLAILPTSLRRLTLDGAPLGNVRFLDSLPSVELLKLDACGHLGAFEPIRKQLGSLSNLSFYGSSFDDLSPEFAGSGGGQNVIAGVRAHFRALEQQGASEDRECKVLLLGNGRVGKTSLVKMLLGEPHDPDESSTHGIRLWTWLTGIELEDDPKAEPVRLNIWDFGGQDLYHNTHRLFLSTKAVFVLVWDPFDAETGTDEQGEANGYLDQKRPLHYWLDQIHSFHPDPKVFIVRSKGDLDAGRQVPDWRLGVPKRYRKYPSISVSAIDDRQQSADSIKGQLFANVTSELGGRARRMLGSGRQRVKESIRKMQATNDLEIRARKKPSKPYLRDGEFRDLVLEHCHGTADAADQKEVLRWLHDTGVVYHRFSLFEDMVIVEQRWAIDGIYTLFDRSISHTRLLQNHGRFRPSQVRAWSWADRGYSDEEQALFLSFMRSCRIAFTLLHAQESAYDEPTFVVPYYLPPRDIVQEAVDRLLERCGSAPVATSWAEQQFLHQGLMGGFLAKLVELYSRSAILWKDGAAFLADDGRIGAVVEWKPMQRGHFGGRIEIQIFGDGQAAQDLLWAIQGTFVFQPSYPEGLTFQLKVYNEEDWEPIESSEKAFNKLSPSARTIAVGQRIAISRAQEDSENPGIGRIPSLLYEQLAPRARSLGIGLLIDEGEHGHSRIVPFMEELAKSDFVYVFLSHKYLLSKWCMFELMRLYQAEPAERLDKERIKMLRYPSARLTLDELDDWWRRQATDLASRLQRATVSSPSDIYEVERLGVSREPCFDWFKFIADRERRWKLLSVLGDTIYEELSNPGQGPPTDAELGQLREIAQELAERAIATLARGAAIR